MKEHSQRYIARAEESAAAATANLPLGHYVVVVNRAYYAIFDCARALLHEHDIDAKTHQGAYVKFNEIFIKTGEISSEMRKLYWSVFELRQSGDYDIDAEVGEDDAVFALDAANQFLIATKQYLSSF